MPLRPNVLSSLAGAAVLWITASRLASATSPSPDEMAAAQSWMAAKFMGTTESRSKAHDEPFFSFTYNGRPSAELLKTWAFRRTRRLLSETKIQHSLTYCDPKTGMVLRCEGVQYRDFPTVEWTVFFRNTGDQDTPILADISPRTSPSRRRPPRIAQDSRRSIDCTTTSEVFVSWMTTDLWRRSSHGGRQSVLRLPADGRPTATCSISICSGPARRG